ncbi:MAG: hypothetical protein GWN62_15820 [Aliifodinibius sp.]|nr:hypothetical protein [Fodinibius sp.]
MISLAVLTDSNPHFRENVYHRQRGGFELYFRFPIVKLIDYAGQEKELENQENPFAIVVRSFLKTLETQGNNQERYSWKKAFLLELYRRGMSRDTVLVIYRFIDWIMTCLPPASGRQAGPKGLDEAIFEEVINTQEEQ